MTEKLVIIGAGGFAREASLLVEEINESSSGEKRWQLLGFIDEDEDKWGLNLRGYPVLGGWSALEAMPADVKVICVVGEPAAKKKLVAKALQEGRQFPALIHPDVSLGRDLKVGQGVLINKGVLLTVDIAIGDHVSINPGCKHFRQCYGRRGLPDRHWCNDLAGQDDWRLEHSRSGCSCYFRPALALYCPGHSSKGKVR